MTCYVEPFMAIWYWSYSAAESKEQEGFYG